MKADKSGIYVNGKHRFYANGGDIVADGSEFVGERKKGPAPENRARDAAPENRGIKVAKKADEKKAE